jgi:heme/copper-type cytochrome/quinol oxidase subunit 1
LLGAGVASGLYVIEPLDLQTRPYTQYAVLALVLGAVTVAGAAALAYWAPKIWGRNANNGVGFLAVLAGFAGSGLAGLVLVINGFQTDSSDFLNGVAVAGFVLLAGAVLLAIVSVIGRGGTADDDPWDGLTLEWATTSPPPIANFGELAEVTSPEPLLDWREPETEKASS